MVDTEHYINILKGKFPFSDKLTAAEVVFSSPQHHIPHKSVYLFNWIMNIIIKSYDKWNQNQSRYVI